ncbi:MAG TPA: type II secretion system F family protein, partial [Bacteroidales bacterium]|nr:type II secretion system F family protein [Bacteroidales bacterium]
MNFNLFDSNMTYILLGVVVLLLISGLAIYGVITWSKKGNKVASRLETFVAPDVQPTVTPIGGQIIPREITGSLLSRTLARWFNQFIHFLGSKTPEKQAVELNHKLEIAGNPYKMHAGEYYAFQFLMLLAGVFLAFLLNRDLKHINLTFVLFGGFIIIICLLLPSVWLNGLIRTKQDEIRRGLPDALDMLSVCASAGLGFDQSLQKISDYWDSALGLELKRVTHEMEMGVSRGVALKNMSARLDVDDLTRFIAIVVQAEKIGMSYSEVLH